MAGLAPDLEEILRREQERLQNRQQDLQNQLAAVQEELNEGVRRLGHVQALLGDGVSSEPIVDSELVRRTREHLPNEGNDSVEIAHSILQERGGEPVHYRELADMVLERGGHLTGQDPAQVLVSQLVRDDRFLRPNRRGWYALRVNYPGQKSVGARKRTTGKVAQKHRLGKGRRRAS